MLKLTIKGDEYFDDETSMFVYSDPTTVTIEHSLVTVSKWESIWMKPFLSKTPKTNEEMFSYLECMMLDTDDTKQLVRKLTKSQVDTISNYIDSPMTATTVSDNRKSGSRQIVTSELIYSWMVALNIPFECENWHLNRLLMLIKVCNAQHEPPKKMSNREILARNKALNDSRRKALGTRG